VESNATYYLKAKRGEEQERGKKTMTINLKGKIEFNPQKDILGKTIARNRTSHRQLAGLKGL